MGTSIKFGQHEMNTDLGDKDSALLLCVVINLGTEKHTYWKYLHRNIIYKMYTNSVFPALSGSLWKKENHTSLEPSAGQPCTHRHTHTHTPPRLLLFDGVKRDSRFES